MNIKYCYFSVFENGIVEKLLPNKFSSTLPIKKLGTDPDSKIVSLEKLHDPIFIKESSEIIQLYKDKNSDTLGYLPIQINQVILFSYL